MSGPYVIVEERRTPRLQSRAECIAVAIMALYWLERAGDLIRQAVEKCETQRHEQ
jgi:hypothetical protein